MEPDVPLMLMVGAGLLALGGLARTLPGGRLALAFDPETLGPKGHAFLGKPFGPPTITRDGVPVAPARHDLGVDRGGLGAL